MAYDEGLAQRLREQLSEVGDVTEKKMFGGLAFPSLRADVLRHRER